MRGFSSIRHRVVLAFGGICLAFVVLFFSWNRWDSVKRDQLEQIDSEQRSLLIKSALDASGETLQHIAYDYSYWDEMVSFVSDPTSAWASDNVDTALNEQVSGMWIYDREGKHVHHANLGPEVKSLGLTAEQIRELFKHKRFAHFFLRIGSKVLELRGATIHSSSDAERVGPFYGYMFAGRWWDDAKLAKLRALSSCNVKLAKPDPFTGSDRLHSGEFVMKHALLDSRGKPVAKVEFAQSNIFVSEFLAVQTRQLGVLILFAFIVVVTAWRMTNWLVLRPIGKLSAALDHGDTTALGDIQNRPDEFGRLARLTQEFFEQRSALEAAHLTLEQRVQERTMELERALGMKDEFMANISHELRTPMNGVLGMAELLRETQLDEDQLDSVDTIIQSGEHLLGLLNSILDFSKLEAGRLETESVQYDPTAVIHEVASLMRPLAVSKGLQFDVVVASSVDNVAVGDPVRIRQVLSNLLSNAIKFTSKGHVRLLANVSGSDLVFSVEDSGIGIPLEKQAHVFRAFTQADGSTTRVYGGTGLGLTISKALCELLGGSIGLESIEGHGTTFTVRIPRGTVAMPRAA